jgi:ATP-binding cassette subfamily B protein
LQDPYLFSGAVKENITYALSDFADEKMIEAAKAMGAHDFITHLDKGYDTILKESGSNLSQGQRQLISFARVVLSDPRILILDEATASVDIQTEVIIQQVLSVPFLQRVRAPVALHSAPMVICGLQIIRYPMETKWKNLPFKW